MPVTLTSPAAQAEPSPLPGLGRTEVSLPACAAPPRAPGTGRAPAQGWKAGQAPWTVSPEAESHGGFIGALFLFVSYLEQTARGGAPH